MQFALENVGQPMLPPLGVAGLLGTAIVLLLLYGRHALHRPDPALDLGLFRIRTFRISTLAGGLSRMGANAVPFMLPLMLQVGFGLTPVQSGSLTFVTSLGAIAVRPLSVLMLRVLGFRMLLMGNAVVCAAVIAGFSLIRADTPHPVVFLFVLLFGVVRSIQFMTTNTLTYADTPASKLSGSTSLGGVAQQLTISFAVSIAAALLGVIAGPGQTPITADFHLAFVLVACITLVSAPGFLWLEPGDGAHVSGYRRG